MTQFPQSTTQVPQPSRTGWVGWIYFAGIMMLMLGCFDVIQGLVALFNSRYYLVTEDNLLIKVTYAGWGWPLLIVGVILVAAGLGVMTGKTWARVVGVIAALFSAIVNLAFASAYPVWSALVIAVDVIVIYALTVHGGETRLER